MSYGYAKPKYGSTVTPKMQPFAPARSLATAAAGTPTVGDPFGLLSKRQSPLGGALLDGGITPPKSQPVAAPQGPVSTPPPVTTQTQPGQSNQQAPQAPAAPAYDLNTDPALQAVQAYTGLSDQQAQALYDKQRRDTIIQSGLESLAQNLFPGDKNLAQAAAKNPTSTKATLDTQRANELRDFLDSITTDGHNLGYSGYRIRQEHELGDEYQNALAQAAAGVQSQLDQLGSAYDATRAGNAQQRAGALGDAYNRMLQQFLQNPPTGDQSGTAPDLPAGVNLTGTGGLLQAVMPGGFMARTRRFAA